jgi:hypothetical protein
MDREAALLDYAERLRKFTQGRRAVHLRLSKLRPYNRRAHHMRIATTTFDELVRDFDGALFRLFNNDLIVICNGASVADIDHGVLHLRYLFSDDPLLKSDEEGTARFCTWFDLEEDYDELLDLARRMVSAREQHERRKQEQNEKERSRPIETHQEKQTEKEQEAAAPTPLDPAKLAIVEEAIAQTDLSTLIRRQPICAVARGRKPEPAYYEIYTSIELLRQTMMPDIDLRANPWLFQDLTKHLDRRMIAYLAQNDDATLLHAFSINLNVSTLLTPEFLDFDEALNSGTRGSIVIELQLFDVFADLGNFLFARNFLRERGYRFCLDAMTHMSLPLIDREELGFDLVKLVWSADLYDQLSGVRGQGVREAALKMGSERLILTHCDTEQALEAGDSLGITLYQGLLLDEMLSRSITRRDSIRALTQALQRHRAAGRS